MKLKKLIMLMLIGYTFTHLPITVMASNAEHAEHGDHDEKEGHGEKGHDEHGEEEHEEEKGHGEHEEEGVTKLTTLQMQSAGIVVEPLKLQQIQSVITAPGEINYNRYKTESITPRIIAQLIKRHVVLGEHVKIGQSIVTLSSVEMAEAQGNLLVVDQEWKRVKKLGRKVVSQRRFTEARVNFELAKAKVKAYGMTSEQIESLITSKDFTQANGRFDLVATASGTILKEDFVTGQQIEPGQQLVLITDESSLWVMANVSPKVAARIHVGNKASVRFNNRLYTAEVSQISHTLNETTRTTGIRLNISNEDDTLHAGLFVDIQIETSDQTMALALPESSVMRSPDGDWQVLVQQDEKGEFKGVEIEVLRINNGQAIIKGIKPGTSVVVEGAFFVQSELAKGGFEIHNH